MTARLRREQPGTRVVLGLREVLDAAGERTTLVHCCAGDVPVQLVRESGARGISLDTSLLDGARWEQVAEAVEAGVTLWAGAVPTTGGDWRTALPYALIIGGAVGNVIDRLIYGAVADFLNMSCCGFTNPTSFNVADIAIFAGAIGLVFLPARETAPAEPQAGRGDRTRGDKTRDDKTRDDKTRDGRGKTR